MGSKYNTVICNKCNNELEIQEHEFGNTDVLYITPCKHCIQDKMIKETYSGELEDLRRQNSILVNFFWKIDKECPNIENLSDELTEISDKINFLDCFGNIKTIKKHFDIFNNIESIIDKIIPEYQDVPLEYKVLLLKERTANHITTPEFGFNEDQINQLAEKLTLDNSKIHFIKEFRDLTKLGLKDTKELVESKISQYDFDHTMTFPEARKIILENF